MYDNNTVKHANKKFIGVNVYEDVNVGDKKINGDLKCI